MNFIDYLKILIFLIFVGDIIMDLVIYKSSQL